MSDKVPVSNRRSHHDVPGSPAARPCGAVSRRRTRSVALVFPHPRAPKMRVWQPQVSER